MPDILVNSFYNPHLEQGRAFEELIPFRALQPSHKPPAPKEGALTPFISAER